MMSVPCLIAVLLCLMGYAVALGNQWWHLASFLSVVIAAFTFLGGATPWSVVYLMGAAPLAIWGWQYRYGKLPPILRTQEPSLAASRDEHISRPSCPCAACQPGAGQ